MEGNTIFMNNQLDNSGQEIHYKDDLVNGRSQASLSGVSKVDEPQNSLNEEIIKNIAVEKELSEIASAYNLHKSENDEKTVDLAMEVDTPSNFKDASTFDSDKSESGKHKDESHQEAGENIKGSKDVSPSNGEDIENSKAKEEEDNSQDGDQNSEETTAKQTDSNENSQDSNINNQESNENSQDVTNEDNGAEEDEYGERGIKSKVKIKKEMQSEDEEDEESCDGVCNLCQGEMDTSSHITMSKHLSEVHVATEEGGIQCGVCHKEYQERRSAVRHILNQHLNYKPHKCSQCKKTFARKDHLARHEKSHDPESFECKFCNLEFDSQARLDRHFRSDHSTDTKKRKSRNVTYEEIDSDAIEEVSESESQGSGQSDGSDSDAFCRSWNQKSRRPRRASITKPPTRNRGRPKKPKIPKPITMTKAQQKKLDKERELQKKKRDEETKKREALRRKRKKKDEETRKREALRKKKEKERMREEEKALERLREKERMRELREAKEKKLKEEMKKKLEEIQRKQREEEEHYFDGNYWEPAKKPLKVWSNAPSDEFSIHYTNFYGGNCHEPPKKSLAQLDIEKKLLHETLAGGHFLAGSSDSISANVKVKSENISLDSDTTQGVCGLCGEEYDDSEPQALTKHIYDKHQVLGSEFDKKCAVCSKEYTERKALNRHILHHHLNYKPYPCTFCSKHFSRRDHLTRHLESHSDVDEKNKHICEFCQKSFSRREHLNRHLWVHKDTFKYKCVYCTKAYTKEEHLDRHVKEIHYSKTYSSQETYTSATLI